MFLFSPVLAQQDTLHKKHQTYLGIGFSLGAGNVDGVYADGFFYLQQKGYYLKLKTSGIQEINLFNSPALSVSDVSLIFGKSFSPNALSTFQLGIGISAFKQVGRGELIPRNDQSTTCFFCETNYTRVKTSSFGFPFEIRYHLLLDHTAAIDFGFSANLNQSNSFYGVSIGTALGRLRDRVKKR